MMDHPPRKPKRQVDTSRPNSARVYDYLLGGKDHYGVDEELGRQLPPFFGDAARQNRDFMHRAVGWLAHQGVDQFFDIGTGIPAEPNLHQVAQAITPRARVVYVDNDPIVLRNAEALLISTPQGTTHYIEGDVRQPEAILQHARERLDFEQPIALSLIAVMHFVLDDQDPYGIVQTLIDALCPGSYLVLSHSDLDMFPEDGEEASVYTRHISFRSRSHGEVERFFDGLELLPPGLVTAPTWHQAGGDVTARERSAVWAGIARVKPRP
jgi:hypothetical protein